MHKENITYNQSNFRSQQLTESAKAIGVEKIWNKICQSQSIEEHLDVPSFEQRMNAVVTKWNEIFDERDVIVHRVSQASGWAPEKISQAIALSNIVVSSVAKCLADDCNKSVFQAMQNRN